MRYREGEAYPKEVYADDGEYFTDIVVAYREELRVLYEAGVRNVQIDDPNLACEFHLSLLFGSEEGVKSGNSDRRVRFLFREDAQGVGGG